MIARLLVGAGIAVLAATLLAGCGGSSHTTAVGRSATPPVVVTDPAGQTCAPSVLTGSNGMYCPGDPKYRDPNGVLCPSADATGDSYPWCPGDEPPGSGSPSDQPSAAPATMTRQTDRVVFKVSGSGYPSIQYGSDSDSNSPKGGYGPLGDGNALPWSGSVTYNAGALYYAVSAQLEGSGDISDSVTEVITTYCSDGTHKTERFPLASGHASGGYNIAQAEYTGGDTGNAAQAESDAGC
jgi:hypothetical protein